jgi:hypothetical protein
MLPCMSEVRRPGRWRTGQQNRQRIIDVARERFMRDGYERATVRAIAADAGVDVAMVYYFFGSKEGLFSASTLTGPEHPLHQLATLLDDGPDDVGKRLVRRQNPYATTVRVGAGPPPPRPRASAVGTPPIVVAIVMPAAPTRGALFPIAPPRRPGFHADGSRSSQTP